MRAARPIIASMAAAGLALSLVAAEPATEESVGEASTQMLGADVTATGLGQELTGRLLDIVTEATTADTPSASSAVVPLAFGGQTAGATSASSDGQTSSDSSGGQLGELGGLLGLSASPFSTTAEATADSAIATVDAVTAQLAGLSGILGMEMNTPGITSQVTPDGSDATQGLTVTGLDLSLADLGLGADVLGQLGLSQILDLLSTLNVGDLPGGVSGDLAAIEDLQDQIAGQLDGLGALESSITDTLAQLDALDLAGLQSQLESLLDLQNTLQGIDGADSDTLDDLLGGGSLDDLLDLGGLSGDGGFGVLALGDLGSLTDLIGLLPSGQADLLESLDCGTDPAQALSCVQDAITNLEDTLSVDSIQALLDSLAGDLGDLGTLLDTVTGLVDDLLAELGGLDGLLDTITGLLPDLLGDAASTELLSIGAFDVGMNAVAKDTVENSSASVLCAPTEVVVLGQSTTTPDCSQGLSAVSDVTATISGALGSVTDVLNTLPLAGGLVETGELKVELFGNVVEKVEEVDGVVTATAGTDILDLQLPSLTLDPSAVTGPLGDIGALPVGDLTALTDLVDGLGSQLGVLDTLDGLLAGLDLTGVTDAVDTIDSTGTLSGLVGQVTSLLDGLDAGNLGSLTEAVSTPGLSMVIDPVSTASFETSGAPAAPEAPEDPAAAPSDDPTLPSTGGGLALVAMMALGGAALLGRRRQD